MNKKDGKGGFGVIIVLIIYNIVLILGNVIAYQMGIILLPVWFLLLIVGSFLVVLFSGKQMYVDNIMVNLFPRAITDNIEKRGRQMTSIHLFIMVCFPILINLLVSIYLMREVIGF